MTHTMTPIMTRTTEEVFNSHREAIETLDFEKLAGDYAESALLVTLDGSFKGRDAIRKDFFQAMLAQFPDITINFKKVVFEGDLCLLEWSAEATAMTFPAGIGVLLVQDGLIQKQVEWFQMQPKES
jgi:ketosteroid isomerase-like protein